MKDLHVLIVDDEADLRLGLSRLIGETGACVTAAASGEEALQVLVGQAVDLVISDIKMPGVTGVELLHQVRKNWPAVEVILISGFGTIELAVECLQAGAAHFLPKPFDNEELLAVVSRVGKKLLDLKAQRMPHTGEHGIIAADRSMHAVLDLVDQVATAAVPVLIEGESGTGKELVARAIHRKGRWEKPLVPVNCAALPDSLLESELFGFRKGAFTGADKNYEGILMRADRSTLFLDEVASMSPAFQAKLLRVLQEKTVRPLGSEVTEHTNFRLIAAGNKDLRKLVDNGLFREDLYYRLNVFKITIPPLRDRKADIEPLARHFLANAATTCFEEGMAIPDISVAALAELLQYPWPGNVRELESAVQRAVILCGCGELQPHHFFFHQSESGMQLPAEVQESYEEAKQAILDSFQRQFLQRVLKRTGGNISHAAGECGLTRAAIQKMMKRLNIDRAHFDHD